METFFYFSGAVASLITIWNFVSVKIRRNNTVKGINIISFTKNKVPEYAQVDKLQDYRTPDEADLKKGDWSCTYTGERLPFITLGNFFGDGKLSKALILIRRSDDKAKIVVKRNNESKYIVLMEPSNSPYNILLETVPIGKYKSHWEMIDLKLETQGIKISFLESAEVIMYWDKKSSSFKKYWTAD